VGEIKVTHPQDFQMPSLEDIEKALPDLIKACSSYFVNPPVTVVKYVPKKEKAGKKKSETGEEEDEEKTEDEE